MPMINVKPGSSQELQHIADTLGKSRKVIVVTGAGISTNCGIPDFRSENGLYSLIQAQYNAALQNPPWGDSNTFDIDDRPKKRVKPSYFFEVVAPDGNVVGVIDEQCLTPPRPTQLEQKPGMSPSPPSTSPLSSRSVTPTVNFSDSPPSSPRPSLHTESSTGSTTNESDSQTADIDSSQTSYEPDLDSICVQIPASTIDQSRESRRSSCEPQSQSHFEFISSVNSFKSSANIPIPIYNTSSRPDFRTNSLGHQSVLASATDLTTDSPLSAPKLPETHQSTLQKEESNLSSKSESRALPNLKGRDLFDSMIWSDPFTTSIFYMFISSLRQKIRDQVTNTTDTHQFIKILRDGGRLVRNYTQNIDCLEERLGLSTDISRGPGNRSRFHSKTQREARPAEISGDSPHNGGVEIVLLHGGLGALRCGICGKRTSWDEADREATTLSGQAPDCPSCSEYNARRTGRGRRGLAIGRLRPDIVLYGEEHPNANLVGPLITHDLGLGPDLLLIMGTSLRVHGLKVMIKEFAKAVRTKGGKVVFVNRTKPAESTWGDIIDYWVEWDCDAWVRDVKERRPDIWLPQGTVEDQKKEPPRNANIISKEAPSDGRPPTKRPSRPQATRDDKMNGVYVTFKILDILGSFVDVEGRRAERLPYFERTSPRTSLASTAKPEGGKRHQAPKKRAKSLSNPNPKPAATKANTSKKRKSCPGGGVTDTIRSSELSARVMEQWERLRSLAPTLSAEAPSREALSNLSLNLRESKFPFSATFNHFPNLGGVDPLNQMNLITHPPSGSALPVHHSPKKESSKRRHTIHTYGTRASRVSSNSYIAAVKEETSPENTTWSSMEDTIVVQTQGLEHGTDNSLPAPSKNCPLTPSTRRIKKMGSIGAILSSPVNDVEVWHDAPEIMT